MRAAFAREQLRDVSMVAARPVVGRKRDPGAGRFEQLGVDKRPGRARPVVQVHARAIRKQTLRRQQQRREPNASGNECHVFAERLQLKTVAQRTGQNEPIAALQ